jgi:glycerol-3-phosphate O-acyltransferase
MQEQEVMQVSLSAPKRAENGKRFVYTPPSWLYRTIVPLLSSRVHIDETVIASIKELSANGPLVYALKYRSTFDLNFLRLKFQELGLPVPGFAFAESGAVSTYLSKWIRKDPAGMADFRSYQSWTPLHENVLKDNFEAGMAAAFFLVDEQTSKNIYITPENDPVKILMDLQGKLPALITIIPLTILYDRRPRRLTEPAWEDLLGDPDRPGPIRRLLLATRKWAIPELLAGEPVHLITQFEEFGAQADWENLPFELRKKLVQSINDRIRVNRGPEKLSTTEIKERVLQDERVQRATRDAVRTENISERQAREKTEEMVDEIASDPRFQVHHALYYTLKWLFDKVFEGVDIRRSDFDELKKANADSSLIFVSCHKSHFDYLLIGFFSFINQMAIPYMAAGKNLSFWPVGPILRHAGAFFIRRSFKGMSLYTHVFAAYLKVLVKEKVNMNFYIEGGRSRTGKLLPPRLGMLSFLLQTIHEHAVEDLCFVPVFVGYDQIPEEKSYIKESSGKEKKKETFSQLIKSKDVLKKKFGKVYVRFHSPMSYRDFIERAGYEFENSSVKEGRKALQDFAYHLMYGIVKCGVISPVDIVAAGLVCAGKAKITANDLDESISYLLAAVKHNGFSLADTLENYPTAVKNALGIFRKRKFFEQAEDDASYTLNPDRKPNLIFYKNAFVNYLWAESIFALVVCSNEKITLTDLKRQFMEIKDILEKELILDPIIPLDDIIDGVIAFGEQKAWLKKADDELTVLERKPFEAYRLIIADILEIYYWSIKVAQPEACPIGQKDLIKKITKAAGENRAENLPPSPYISLVALNNALARFAEQGVLEYRAIKKAVERVSDPELRNKNLDFLEKLLFRK